MVHEKRITLLVVIMLFIPVFGSSAIKKNVLVLHSYHQGLSWTQKSTQGIHNIFQKYEKGSVIYNVDYEYMDTKRFVSSEYYDLLLETYKRKSKKLKYDIIISTDDNALNFLLKHRDEIWGKVPVVFCGVNFLNEKEVKKYWGYTGIVEEPDVKATIDIALKLHPDTKNIYIVGDKTTTSDMDRKAVNKVIGQYGKYNFHFMKEASVKPYREVLLNLPPKTIVLFMHFNRDLKGKYYSFEESFDILTPGVEAPIYSFWDFYINRGSLVGGMIVSGVAQGEEAAKKALKILQGTDVDFIPIMKKSPNEYMFDYNVMQKFGLSMDDLPKNSKIFNKPKTLIYLYHEYKVFILGVLALVSFLTTVIIILTLNILRRRRVEKQLRLTNRAYNRFVPHEFLDLLGRKDIISVELGDQKEDVMTFIFSDIRSFTNLSEKMTPEENFNFLNSYLSIMSPIIRQCNGFIDKYIGDAIMAIFPEDPEDAVRAASEMQRAILDYNVKRGYAGYDPIAVGMGVHTGRTMMGTVGGEDRMEGTVISDAVNLASRLEGLTKVYGANILVSGDVIAGLEDMSVKYTYRFLGKVKVKGKESAVEIYEVIDGSASELLERKLKSKSIFEKGMKYYFEKDFEKAGEKFENVLKLNPGDKAATHLLGNIDDHLATGVSEDWEGIETFDYK